MHLDPRNTGPELPRIRLAPARLKRFAQQNPDSAADLIRDGAFFAKWSSPSLANHTFMFAAALAYDAVQYSGR